MLFEECPAPPGLQPFVTGFWYVRTSPVARYEKILPGPSAHLVLNLSDPYRLIDPSGSEGPAQEVAAGFYSGLQRTYLISENPAQIFNVGAVLAPFGVAAFTEQPPSALTGRVVDAGLIFPGLGALCESLRHGPEGPTPERAFAALESFLTGRLRPGYRLDERTATAVGLLARDDIPVADLSGRLGLSTSTLERIMMRDCGTTPKGFSDVCRFHRFVNAVAAMPPGTAAGRDLLALADYYDQPHLIRSFRRFSGFTPSEYLRLIRQHGPDYATFVPVEELPASKRGMPDTAAFLQDHTDFRR
ncbi:AraC family transcriptional regulator [Pseudarthrobacter sp. SSS035]|uniref:helix-turn-helix domain-containing protein n=1 Tax=Pseudarthrobacter sp. SSS035 TaxID=2931399 RepID=UPI00200C08B1|nr:AraC family transcriptional regulator [Pseudarthrobacter sp. SSS035]